MPDLPWQKVAADFLEYDRKMYLLVVDFYSRFIEIALMTTMTTAQTVRHMQSMFARHGFPETLVSDNGPQFSSAEFAAFATKHKIHHVTFSPLYPQANGMAERAVQTVKRLLRSSDPYDALLAYKTTPLENGYSPVELLFSRRLRTSVPITSTQRQPSLVDQHIFKTRTEDIQQRQQQNYNERHRARELPDLPPGTRVYIPDRQEEGQTATSPTTRSYIVTTPSGDFRRNRRHITPLLQPSSSDTPVPSAQSTSNSQPAQDGALRASFQVREHSRHTLLPPEGERSDCNPKWAFQLPTHSSEHLNETGEEIYTTRCTITTRWFL